MTVEAKDLARVVMHIVSCAPTLDDGSDHHIKLLSLHRFNAEPTGTQHAAKFRYIYQKSLLIVRAHALLELS